jgi:hypothetical protein
MDVAVHLLAYAEPGAYSPEKTVGPQPLLCPSSLPEFGAEKVPMADGTFRTAGRCQTSRCAHWSDHCGLGVAVSVAGRGATERGLSRRFPCGLSTTCRWFAENGADACQICDLVTRDPADSPALRETVRMTDRKPDRHV